MTTTASRPLPVRGLGLAADTSQIRIRLWDPSSISRSFDNDRFPQGPLVVGRVLLVLVFILAGIGKLTNVSGTAGYIASAGLPMALTLAVLVGGLAVAIGFQVR